MDSLSIKLEPVLVFLTGPFQEEVANNIVKTTVASKNLWEAGYVVISPYLNSGVHYNYIDKHLFELGYQFLLRECANSIEILLMEGWQQSKRTLAELVIARNYNIPIFEYEEIRRKDQIDRPYFGNPVEWVGGEKGYWTVVCDD